MGDEIRSEDPPAQKLSRQELAGRVVLARGIVGLVYHLGIAPIAYYPLVAGSSGPQFLTGLIFSPTAIWLVAAGSALRREPRPLLLTFAAVIAGLLGSLAINALFLDGSYGTTSGGIDTVTTFSTPLIVVLTWIIMVILDIAGLGYTVAALFESKGGRRRHEA